MTWRVRAVAAIAAACVGVCAVVVGCAEVLVRKVPAAGQHVNWNDERQDEADQIRGFRHYLPRPYVVVKRPFPVGGHEYLAFGTPSRDGEKVTISAINMSPALREELGMQEGATTHDIPTSAMTVPASAQTAAAQPVQGESGSDRTAQSDKDTKKDDAAKRRAIEGDKVSASATPGTLQATDDTFTVDVTLKKESGFASVATDSARVALLPLNEKGDVDVEKAVLLPKQKPADFDASKEWKNSGAGRRSDLGKTPASFYAAGLVMTAIAPGKSETENLLVYSKKVVLSVVGGSAPASEPPKKESEGSKKTEETRSASTASVATSGDPRTDPLTKLAEAPFDVLLLPDTDEQYAIEVRGGLGQASAKIGFENGWMLETAETAVDNRELGKFIFEQINKFTDIGASALSASLGIPPVGGAEKAKEKASQKAQEGGQVLLKITIYDEAQPGLVPVLKSREIMPKYTAEYERAGGAKLFADEPGHAYLPYRPYTVVAFQTVRRVAIQLMDVGSGGKPAPAPGGGQPVPEPGLKHLPNVASEFTKIKIGNESTSLASKLIELTMKEDLSTVTWFGIPDVRAKKIFIYIELKTAGHEKFYEDANKAIEADLKAYGEGKSAAKDLWDMLFKEFPSADKTEVRMIEYTPPQ